MPDSTRQKPLAKTVLIIIALTVISLGIIFALLATIGDDIPNQLSPAGQGSPGE
jgi:hypothetical protein